MVSASKFVAVSLNDPNPAVLDFELSSAAPASVISFLGFAEPDECHRREFFYGHGDVEWGSSLRRRGGDALQQQYTAARVPSSVTVAAGATSATFTVSTSAVAARLQSASPEPTAARPDRLRSA